MVNVSTVCSGSRMPFQPNILAGRGLSGWTARTTSSFSVAVAPHPRTAIPVVATLSMSCRTRSRGRAGANRLAARRLVGPRRVPRNRLAQRMPEGRFHSPCAQECPALRVMMPVPESPMVGGTASWPQRMCGSGTQLWQSRTAVVRRSLQMSAAPGPVLACPPVPR
jgi:hypothetical protein